MRIAAVVLVAALALAGGCKTTQSDAPTPTASTYDGEGNPKLKFKDEGGGGGGGGGSSGGPTALDWVAVPFENIVYLPWKFIGGMMKGASDGVSSGFTKDRMPILGILFSPVNLIAGGLTGAIEGTVGSPGVVGPSDSFSHAMAQPTRHATSIWWYE